jgi:LysR family hydrogen peroxide-inducible transcriptional activator
VRLGATLLERSATGAVLTPVGRGIVTTARRLLSDARGIAVSAAGVFDLSGMPQLGSALTLGSYPLPPIIVELHRMAPRLRLHRCEGVTDEQGLELSRGNTDVMLGCR